MGYIVFPWSIWAGNGNAPGPYRKVVALRGNDVGGFL